MLKIDQLLNNEALKVFILSMLPITELRFSIPYAINFYNLPVSLSVLLSIIGNILIGVVVIYLIGPIMTHMKKYSFFNTIISWIFKRTVNRSSIIERRKFYGLIIFVAIPLPLTGVWTGALASYLLNLPSSKSILAIIVGVLISSTIVTTLTLLSIDLL